MENQPRLLSYLASILCYAFFVFALNVNAQAQASGTLRGRILDDRGQPVAGAVVMLSNGRNAAADSLTGSFVIAGLPIGVYSSSITAPLHSASVVFDISGGRVTDVGDIVLTLGPSIPRRHVGVYREVGTTRTIARERLDHASDVTYSVYK